MSTKMSRRRAPRRRAEPPLVGALLRLAWQEVRRQMAADVAAAGFVELQDAHLSVFQYPGPDGLRPVDVARQARISRQSANYLIAQLEQSGYLQRRTGSVDARRRVYVTERGVRLLAAIQASVRRFESHTATIVGARSFEQCVDVLRTMAGETAAARAPASRRRRRRREA